MHIAGNVGGGVWRKCAVALNGMKSAENRTAYKCDAIPAIARKAKAERNNNVKKREGGGRKRDGAALRRRKHVAALGENARAVNQYLACDSIFGVWRGSPAA